MCLQSAVAREILLMFFAGLSYVFGVSYLLADLPWSWDDWDGMVLFHLVTYSPVGYLRLMNAGDQEKK
jgi:hypothetical protein